jgi:hypothetical protein
MSYTLKTMDNSNQNNNSEWRNRELGALWVRQGKGQKYLSGHLEVETMPGVTEKIKVVVFSNKGKAKNEQAPDYVVYKSVDRDSQQENTSSTQNSAEAVESTEENTGEEIPAALV